jgi:hypothetical protein
MPTQYNWRWCRKCQGLAFAGNGGGGVCPAGGKHVHIGSWNYNLQQDSPSAVGQCNWRWCQKCQGLAFAGSPADPAYPKTCPAGGKHDHTISSNYCLFHDSSSTAG